MFVVWSDTVDAPVSHVMERTAMIEHLVVTGGIGYLEALTLVDTAERDGVSDPTVKLAQVIAANRAGVAEEFLSIEEIIEASSVRPTPPA